MFMLSSARLAPAAPEDAAAVCDLIRARIRWLDEKGLHGWNDHDYLSIYPQSYFAHQAELGHLYVLRLPAGALAASIVLLDQDENWAGFPAPAAYYLHNLVSAPDHPGSGLQLLRAVEQLARGHSKTCLRLDNQAGNAALTELYESEGYLPVGTCHQGLYLGILREKIL